MVAQSIGSWVKKHTKEETMALIGSGVTIRFKQEALTSRDEMFTLLLEGAYMYHQIQSGIWSERNKAGWKKRQQSSKIPGQNVRTGTVRTGTVRTGTVRAGVVEVLS